MAAISQTQISLHYREKLNAYWADYLGCATDALMDGGDTIVHCEKSPGLFCLEIGDNRILSLAAGVEIKLPFGPLTREWVYNALSPAGGVADVYGPGHVLYCTATTFEAADEMACRRLSDADQNDLKHFSRLVQWEGSLPRYANQWTSAFGVYQDGQLVSAATSVIWGEVIGALKVATLPAYRGRGYARAVTSAATRALLNETNLIPQYDTAATNVNSQRIARALGFLRYGQIFYGKLKNTHPHPEY